MDLLEQLRALIVAEGSTPSLWPVDAMGMMTGLPIADLSGLPEYQAQADALVAGASVEELGNALARAGDPDGPVASMLRRELARRQQAPSD